MTDQELEEINERFRAEAQYIHDSDPGQGYPYFEGEEEDEEAENERRVNWECWQDDMYEISRRSLRLFRNQLVEGGLYSVHRYAEDSVIEGLSLLTYIGEEPRPDEWQDNDIGSWNVRFVFLMADGGRLHLTWSVPCGESEARCFSIYDQDDYIFSGIDIFTRIS